jgi:hypothetical protein
MHAVRLDECRGLIQIRLFHEWHTLGQMYVCFDDVASSLKNRVIRAFYRSHSSISITLLLKFIVTPNSKKYELLMCKFTVLCGSRANTK